MRNETLLKVIIAVFAIVLIVLATFVYGNVQRSKQKTSTGGNNQASVSTPNSATTTLPDQSVQPNQAPPAASKPAAPAPASAATPPVAPTPTKTAAMPSTGAEGAVIPMTVLAVLGYILVTNRWVVRSKSQLR